MILYHHPEVELSRNLLATLPEGVEVIDCSINLPNNVSVSAYPSVSINAPTFRVDMPSYNELGDFIGMSKVEIPAAVEMVRCPATWQVVADYISFLNNKAAASYL